MARALENRRHPFGYFEFRLRHTIARPSRLLAVCIAVMTTAALIVGMLPATPAEAEPTLAEIEAQIDAKWLQLEPVIERYNKVHSQLKANQKKSVQLRKRIQPLSLQAQLATYEIGEIANRYYRAGPSSGLNALLATGSATTLADQLVILDRISKQQHDQIAAVTAARDKYLGEQAKLDALIAEQQEHDTELAAKRKQIDAEIKRLQQLRSSAYGSTTSGGDLRIGACPAVYVGGAAGIAVKTACAQIGKPYVWGAAGPNSFDCSGLTQFSWAKAGVSLTHFTGAQWNQGTSVSRANARPGDLVFFYSDLHHVGMYVGNGLMVHASRAGKPVQMARIDNMPIAGFKRVG